MKVFNDKLQEEWNAGERMINKSLTEMGEYLNLGDTIQILQDKSTKEGHQQRVIMLGVVNKDPFQVRVMAINIKDKEG